MLSWHLKIEVRSLKTTAQKYCWLYGLFQGIVTDFRVHVWRCSLTFWAGFVMITHPVLVTDYSGSVGGQNELNHTLEFCVYCFRKQQTDKIIDYFRLKGTSGGQTPLSPLSQLIRQDMIGLFRSLMGTCLSNAPPSFISDWNFSWRNLCLLHLIFVLCISEKSLVLSPL